MQVRRTYDEMKIGSFKLMYLARQRITKEKRPWLHPIEDVGVAFDDPYYEGMNDLHRLMDETIYLILCAGLSPEPGLSNATAKIKEILAANPLEVLLEGIPEQEGRELRIDLEILGFIPPDITKPQFA